MKALRTLKPRKSEQTVTAQTDAEWALQMHICMALANRCDTDDAENLLLIYRDTFAVDVGRHWDRGHGGARRLPCARAPAPDPARGLSRGTRAVPRRRAGRAGAAAAAGASGCRLGPQEYVLGAHGALTAQHTLMFDTDAALYEFVRAVLGDPRFDADRVRQCARDGCSRFYWRDGKRIYCSAACGEAVDAADAKRRVAAWRAQQKKARRSK